MPTVDRNLSAGRQPVGRYKSATYRIELVQTEAGLRYR
jgi:hypothetical protein